MTREEAIKLLKEEEDYNEGYAVAKAYGMAIEALQEPKKIIGIYMPYGSDKGVKTIFKVADGNISLEEVEEIMPVKHAKWEKNEPLPSEWQYKCSECGVPSKSNSHNFCPNCGAKMDGGAK